MAIGFQPTVAQLNAQAAQLAVNFRQNAIQAQLLGTYINNLGSASRPRDARIRLR